MSKEALKEGLDLLDEALQVFSALDIPMVQMVVKILHALIRLVEQLIDDQQISAS